MNWRPRAVLFAGAEGGSHSLVERPVVQVAGGACLVGPAFGFQVTNSDCSSQRRPGMLGGRRPFRASTSAVWPITRGTRVLTPSPTYCLTSMPDRKSTRLNSSHL